MEVTFLKIIFSFLISFLLTFYLVPLFRRVAFKLQVLDVPDGKIKNHVQKTPYLGGVAVYIGFISTLAITYPFQNHILLFLIGSTLLLFVGLIDDLLVTKPYQKFFGQMIATLCFLKAGFHLKENFFLHNYWNIPISFFWILSVINAFNLVDVMDGLATSLAIYATLSFIVIAIYLHQINLVILLAAFLGALLAFFWYNKPLATIYLGDAGSLFIGGFLATVPFLFNWSLYNWYGFLSPLIILAIPLVEVGTLIVIRTYKKIPFYYGSPDHFSIYLKNNGWNIYEILLFISFLSVILLFLSLFLFLNKIRIEVLLLMGFLFLGIWMGALLHKRRIPLK